jgi:protein TonB
MNVITTALRLALTSSCGIAAIAVVFLGLREMTQSNGENAFPLITPRKVNFTQLRHDTSTETKRDREKPKPPAPTELPPTTVITISPCRDCGAPIALAPALQPTLNPGDRTRPNFSVGGTNEAEVQPIFRMLPDYPANGRGDGWVLVQFDITRVGTVANARVVDASPRGMFEKNALKAIERWRYRPAVHKGQAVERRGLRVRLSFVLERA